jgi:hypothetical protein
MMMEDLYFFPAAVKALKPQDWAEIASSLTAHKDPLFSYASEKRFDALRAHILHLEQEAEAERKPTLWCWPFPGAPRKAR